MPRISQLPSLTTAAVDDELAIVDTSTATTKKVTPEDLAPAVVAGMAAGSLPGAKIEDGTVTSDKLAPSKTVDANGWTVYDYGTWKEYVKAVSGTTGTIAPDANTAVSSGNLPVGVDNLSGYQFMYSVQVSAGLGSFSDSFSGVGGINVRLVNRYSTNVSSVSYRVTFRITTA